jgi:tetratricopeptide (TPR) repeat protein
VDRDPLSAQALFTLARAQLLAGRQDLATKTLQRAVRLQPSNPETWLALGESQLARNPRAALAPLSAAIYLDPESISPQLIARGDPEAITIQNDYVRALRASASAPVKPRVAGAALGRAGAARRARAARRAGATARPTLRSPAGRTGRATRSSSNGTR